MSSSNKGDQISNSAKQQFEYETASENIHSNLPRSAKQNQISKNTAAPTNVSTDIVLVNDPNAVAATVTCWNIVGEDIYMLLQEFHGGAPLQKSITNTNLVLLPKKPQVKTFSDL